MKNPDEESRSLTIKGFNVGWEKYESLKVPIIPPLSDWFDTKITVRGESVYIYINDELIFQEESFLKISVGKVGFRNDGKELAKVRNVKVRIER